MAKQPTAPLPWDDNWSDHPIFLWVSQHSRNIGYGVLVILLLLIVIYRILSHHSNKTEQDYQLMAQVMTQLDQSEKSTNALQDMKSLLTRYPSLMPVYDGLIAQDLLNQNQPEEAMPFMQQTWSRIKGDVPSEYLDYGQGTLLMSQKQYEIALQQAYALRQHLLDSDMQNAHFGNTLYAFNLIRIATLEKYFDHKDQERKAWDELVKMPNFQEKQKVMTHFDQQGASLKQYINL